MHVVVDDLEVALVEGDQLCAVVYGATKEEAVRLALRLRSSYELRLVLEQEEARHTVENDGFACNCVMCDLVRSYAMGDCRLLKRLSEEC